MFKGLLYRYEDLSALARYSPQNAKRRLRRILIVFLVCLIMPLYVLVTMVHEQIKNEASYKSRVEAEDLLALINERLQDLLRAEDSRPFGDYSFFNIAENPLSQKQDLSLSPLASFPPAAGVPGIIGYFQVDPDGSFHSPVLPEYSGKNLGFDAFGWSSEELKRREQLRNRLKHLLQGESNFLQISSLPAESPRRLSFAPPAAEKRKSGLYSYLLQEAWAQQPPAAENSESRRKIDFDPAPESQPGSAANQVPLSMKKLSEFNIEQGDWNAQEEDKSLERRNDALNQQTRRKFKVVIPEPKTQLEGIQALRGQDSIDKPEAGAAAESEGKEDLYIGRAGTRELRGRELQRQAPHPVLPSVADEKAPPAKRGPEVSVLIFEGELDPFQMRALGTDYLAFYRKVWRKKQRYIQGFICSVDEFFGHILSIIENSRLSSVNSVVIGYNGEVFRVFDAKRRQYAEKAALERRPEPRAQERQILLFKDFLPPPLDGLEIVFTAREIPLAPGASLVNFLVVCLTTVLVVGLWGIYRLGVGQISLAAERSNFVSAVSHELKTPLTSIRMYAEMLRSGWLVDEQRRKSYYDFIFFESERLSRLIANVLHLSRLSTSSAPLELREYSLLQLVELIKTKVSSQTEAAGFQLALQLPDEGALARTILVEDDAFARIFINLFDNALKFSAKSEPKTIQLKLHVGGESALFSVRDFGPGIDKAHAARIFQLFYRGQDELTRTVPGTGIGLALVKELCSRLRANISYRNCSPGAEFEVSFPLAEEKRASSPRSHEGGSYL